ncbi:NmrA family NAD(P)-binding protein [Nonomuraea sp. NN258]|uniref:SDR family oxidoreductase n=1 Tax=Nonomuraea antri TaxID=2730852 RepID=UPI0015696142|nr:NmrA family NAD(P)-binding protein [Nonomuraea antri]NRQ36145.1 NmrA family NAD(P)-binding protein [Nonomuraea antri]
MRFLVTGASGAQGGAIARLLAGLGHRVRGFARTANVPDGVRPFPGDLGDAARVKEAFDGVTHAAVLLPMTYDRERVETYVGNVVAAAGAAGVRRLVFNTGNRIPAQVTGVPAFETRRWAAAALLDSGLPAVVLRPPVYLDNLLAPWVSGPLAAEGVLRYPLPAGLPVSWLSHADLAAATAAALTVDGLAGATLDLGGADLVTGPELAAAFGPGVRYAAQDVAEFAAGLSRLLGPDAAEGVAATYRWLGGLPAGDRFYAADPGVAVRLGVRPTPMRDWIAARTWPVSP